MKRLMAMVLACLMMVSLVPAAGAAYEKGLSNFQKTNHYETGQFKDVASTAWYADNVKTAYELGLVKGSGANTFNPDGNITIAETLALACRLHSIYYGGTGTFTQGSPWYQVYVDYAIEQGIIQSGTYSKYTAKATRAQFASILAAALPSSALKAINSIKSGSLPDVPASASYAKAVYLLYNAGVLTGSDKFGTFNPNSNIKRSEVATVVTRMADSSTRKTFTPATKPSASQLKEDYTEILSAMRNALQEMQSSLQYQYSYYESVANGTDMPQESVKILGNASRHMSASESYVRQTVSLIEQALVTYSYDSKICTPLRQACTILQKALVSPGFSIENFEEISDRIGEVVDILTGDLNDYVVQLIQQEGT